MNDFIEPKEYFQVLKSSVKTAEEEKLKNQLSVIANNIIEASEAGQKAFAEKLSFHYACIHREQVLLANGFNKFVYREDIESYIDKCVLKNGKSEKPLVKIIDLDNYLRVIPKENIEVLKKAQSLKIIENGEEIPVFTDFLIVFTDLSGEIDLPEEKKQFKERNRDPIIFGYFSIKHGAIVHDRLYFITDWEDDDCDLTFEKLISDMENAGYKSPEKEINYDLNYLNELVNNHLSQIKKAKNYDDYVSALKEHNKTIWEKVKAKIKGIF